MKLRPNAVLYDDAAACTLSMAVHSAASVRSSTHQLFEMCGLRAGKASRSSAAAALAGVVAAAGWQALEADAAAAAAEAAADPAAFDAHSLPTAAHFAALAASPAAERRATLRWALLEALRCAGAADPNPRGASPDAAGGGVQAVATLAAAAARAGGGDLPGTQVSVTWGRLSPRTVGELALPNQVF